MSATSAGFCFIIRLPFSHLCASTHTFEFTSSSLDLLSLLWISNSARLDSTREFKTTQKRNFLFIYFFIFWKVNLCNAMAQGACYKEKPWTCSFSLFLSSSSSLHYLIGMASSYRSSRKRRECSQDSLESLSDVAAAAFVHSFVHSFARSLARCERRGQVKPIYYQATLGREWKLLFPKLRGCSGNGQGSGRSFNTVELNVGYSSHCCRCRCSWQEE